MQQLIQYDGPLLIVADKWQIFDVQWLKLDIAIRSEVEISHVNTKYKLKAGFSYFYYNSNCILTRSAVYSLYLYTDR